MGIPENVAELLGPIVANLGVELVDVEHNGAVLRLTVDSEGGVDTDTLAKINRLVSPMLDENDPISSRYTLEVSSPGIERKLKTVDHFERSIGETVIIKLVPTLEIRRVKGELLSVSEGEIVIAAVEVDGIDLGGPEERTIRHSDVLKARTFFNFEPTPKKGGTKPGKQKKNAGNKNAGTKNNKQGSGSTTTGTQQDKGIA